MNRLLQYLFSVQYPYTDPAQRQQARSILTLVWLQMVALLALVIANILFPAQSVLGTGNEFIQIGLITSLLIAFIIYSFVQTGRSQAAGWLLMGLIVVSNFAQVIEASLDAPIAMIPGNVLLLIIPLVAAATLTGTRGFAAIFVLSIVLLFWLVGRRAGMAEPVTIVPAELAFATLSEVLIAFFTIGLILMLYIRGTRRVLTEGVSEIGHWHKIADLNTRLAPIETEPEAVTTLLETVRDNLGYNAGWFYITNREGQFTRLLRINLGKLDIVEGDALSITANSPMVDAVKHRQMEFADLTDMPTRRRHLLPTSRASVSVLVLYQGDLLGVLDVQHTQAFHPDDLETIQQVAVALGTALGRIRLLTDLRQSVREQERTSQQLRTQLSDLRQREGVGVSNAWSRYLGGRGQKAVGFDLESQGMSLTPASDLPPALAEALANGKVHVQATPEGNIINVPIRFREQTLGAMSFTLPAGQQPGSRQLDMAAAVAERLALALENTRLIEQTQAQAQRERTASAVSTRLLGQTDVRRLLDEAADSFTQALNAVHTRIYIRPGVLAEPALSPNPAEVPAS